MKKLACLLALLPGALSAQTVVQLVTYNFDGTSPGQSPTISSSALVASAVNSFGGPGVTVSRSTITVTNLSGNGTYGTGQANTTVGNAVGFGTTASASLYVGFSATLQGSLPAGNDYTLDSIVFDLGNGGTTGPRGFEVTYRIGTTGSFTSLGTAQVPNNTANNFGRYTFEPSGSISLTAGDVIELRFLGFAPGATSGVRYDNVTINALETAMVPEPSAVAALAGFGALGFAALRRRRRG